MRLCHLKHVLLDLFEQSSRRRLQLLQRHRCLLSRITADQYCLTVLNISRTDLDPERNAAHLAVGKLESGALLAVIQTYTHPCFLQAVSQLCSLVQNACLLLLDRTDHDLHRRDMRRQLQTVVIAVHHDDGADDAGAQAP